MVRHRPVTVLSRTRGLVKGNERKKLLPPCVGVALARLDGGFFRLNPNRQPTDLLAP
jgi:hypothetical protein